MIVNSTKKPILYDGKMIPAFSATQDTDDIKKGTDNLKKDLNLLEKSVNEHFSKMENRLPVFNMSEEGILDITVKE